MTLLKRELSRSARGPDGLAGRPRTGGRVCPVAPVHRDGEPSAAKADPADGTRDDRARHPVRSFERFMKPTQKFSEHKPGNTSACIDGCKYKERFEHNREVIPVLHKPAHPGNRIEYLSDSNGKRNRSARPTAQVLLTGFLC